ncbi:unnamed protein product (macronuclear) [Paramecium tetraurelia]|uniref:Uncharacterized protein n=1 Tax=Paramecium tetraurelia TaxID=5888 RepID=A0CUP8_PARTE|nr:uncharacterized protein GSPATT00010715001 [Paramecium tetraurelia]CAK74515.1 unnamed protein product [Paramecium tetraurelia]|eukprot:XP_001441912.1 hypothetical protein (macronuclear) [Paramecium tetraurelia strain d4-2]
MKIGEVTCRLLLSTLIGTQQQDQSTQPNQLLNSSQWKLLLCVRNSICLLKNYQYWLIQRARDSRNDRIANVGMKDKSKRYKSTLESQIRLDNKSVYRSQEKKYYLIETDISKIFIN